MICLFVVAVLLLAVELLELCHIFFFYNLVSLGFHSCFPLINLVRRDEKKMGKSYYSLSWDYGVHQNYSPAHKGKLIKC